MMNGKWNEMEISIHLSFFLLWWLPLVSRFTETKIRRDLISCAAGQESAGDTLATTSHDDLLEQN